LIWRAAAALWRALGRDGEPRDAHVRLEKNIPAAAGLGGGSANAAAALVGLNRLWQGRLTLQGLVPIAATLGADVPFFLVGGTAVGVGRGDEIYPVDDVSRLGVIIIKPSIQVATPDAYRWLDEDRAAGRGGGAMAKPLDVGWSHGPVAVGNDLQASVARRHAVIDEMVSACLRQGALTSAMTGSGSAVFGVFREAAARAALQRLQRPDWWLALTRTLSRSEARRQMGLGSV
jgi:4-diphosphocytidyl-2-C-methyl-D-erythritol kinase